ncbi:hypothetical protein Dda_2069 [Drechslerella dactyloides]|uniref:NADP-dependent oxidoreductase domain-containing protein n=1 Tax=Drechslerella dactyloides TaxID=74499 RepID=A0AAD6J571_DREDA|nr:hypothetical protein Dda_2069 [Drechslerella dactyloides]
MPAAQTRESRHSHPPIAAAVPPLFLGTAAFNSQYNADPFALPVNDIVSAFLNFGSHTTAPPPSTDADESSIVRPRVGFDTSPYYGPAELLLGRALAASSAPRSSYFLSTKAGRISSTTFNLSPSWLRHSVHRSLKRLKTDYIDLIYVHDVEFVTPAEVLTAVLTLRKLRDEGLVRYIGISGFPVAILCKLATLVLRATGEPLDAVLSYANYTVQNTRLATEGVRRLLLDARVGCIVNGSLLGMGLLRSSGVPVGAMGDFHPAGQALRRACADAAKTVTARGGKLEDVAYRWALENWTDAAKTITATSDATDGAPRTGVSVMGVSYLPELHAILKIYTDVLAAAAGDAAALARKTANNTLADELKTLFGERYDEVWESPGADFARGEMKVEYWRSDDELWPQLQKSSSAKLA